MASVSVQANREEIRANAEITKPILQGARQNMIQARRKILKQTVITNKGSLYFMLSVKAV